MIFHPERAGPSPPAPARALPSALPGDLAYVVPGTARFTVGETTYEAPAGTLVMVPPGVPHTFANPTDAATVLLNTFTPDLCVEYFRDLRGMIAGGQPLTAETTVEAMNRYATEPASDFA